MTTTDGAIGFETFSPAAVAGRAAVRPFSIERIPVAAWDRAIADFDGICPEQTMALARLRWPGLEQEPLLFRQNGAIVGGALMMVQRLPLRLGAVAIAKWAPMLRASAEHDRYPGMMEALITEYADRRGMMLSVLPRAHGDGSDHEQRHLLARGFTPGSNVTFPARYIVDLAPPETEHRKRLHSKWRYHLGKAEKAGLSFECAGPERLPAFDALYAAMSDRKRFPDHSAYATVPAMFAMPEERLRPRLFFVRHDGAIVAGAVIFTGGDTAGYMYGATSAEALPLRAGYFMHWQIVRWLKANTRARWYDLGGSDGFLGLHQFKKGMVGDAGTVAMMPPVMHLATRRRARMVGTAAFAVRDTMLGVRQRLARWRGTQARPDLTPGAPLP